MAPSPRDGVQPVEFNDEAFYSVLGRDLAITGTRRTLAASGFAELPGLPPRLGTTGARCGWRRPSSSSSRRRRWPRATSSCCRSSCWPARRYRDRSSARCRDRTSRAGVSLRLRVVPGPCARSTCPEPFSAHGPPASSSGSSLRPRGRRGSPCDLLLGGDRYDPAHMDARVLRWKRRRVHLSGAPGDRGARGGRRRCRTDRSSSFGPPCRLVSCPSCKRSDTAASCTRRSPSARHHRLGAIDRARLEWKCPIAELDLSIQRDVGATPSRSRTLGRLPSGASGRGAPVPELADRFVAGMCLGTCAIVAGGRILWGARLERLQHVPRVLWRRSPCSRARPRPSPSGRSSNGFATCGASDWLLVSRSSLDSNSRSVSWARHPPSDVRAAGERRADPTRHPRGHPTAAQRRQGWHIRVHPLEESGFTVPRLLSIDAHTGRRVVPDVLSGDASRPPPRRHERPNGAEHLVRSSPHSARSIPTHSLSRQPRPVAAFMKEHGDRLHLRGRDASERAGRRCDLRSRRAGDPEVLRVPWK